MAAHRRVGPKHRADTAEAATAAAWAWLDEHRPQHNTPAWPDSVHAEPTLDPDDARRWGRWTAVVRADWTPDVGTGRARAS
jgi:hypothetical protein